MGALRTAATLTATIAALAFAASGQGAPDTGTPATATRVKVTLKEWTLKPSRSQVAAGRITFIARNVGNIEHEFVIVRTSTHHHSLPVTGGVAQVSELAEIEELAPGQTKRLTVKLRAGTYVLLCNVQGHYRAGQYAAFRVS